MRRVGIYRRNIPSAADEIFHDYLSNAFYGLYYEAGQNFYFEGWDGLGASAVLAAIAELARSLQEPGFDTVIHVDCSVWESRRAMQRRIAEELKLDRSAMELFDNHDENDDFSGVDKSNRAEIDDVRKLIYNMTKGRKLLVVFQNGSDHEIDLATSGLPIFHSGNRVLWTFRGRFRLDPTIQDKVKSAHYYLYVPPFPRVSSTISDKLELVREEASQVQYDISPDLIIDCWLYLCFLYFDHDNLIDYDENAHASNYWVCDGIIPAGDSAWQIGQSLNEAMQLEYIPAKQNNGELFSWFPFEALQEKKRVWISVTCNNVQNQNIQTVPEDATSYFLTLDKSDHPTALPKHLFQQSSKLHVLRLSSCTFSFVSPPFIYCRNLKFILMDCCRDEDVEFIGDTREEQVKEWEFLKSLWVLDIRDTNWDWILSPSKMRQMTELRELNLKAAGASSCVWDMGKLELTWLCNLHRLRVIDSSTFLIALVHDSFMGMQKLELLDLSGNSDMDVLPNISATSSLRVLIVDGCAGLQEVEPGALPKSLESFSFDGFGRASRWKNTMQMPEEVVRPRFRGNQEPPKVSKISLEGCQELNNIFLRGLPNLKELNLSDTAIKELSLRAIQVVEIECLLLLGCQNIHRLKWSDGGHPRVKLLCIDFREKEERELYDDCCQYYACPQVQQQASQQIVHIFITDAKFLRAFKRRGFDNISSIAGITDSNQHFHIHLASCDGRRKVIEQYEERVIIPSIAGYPYMDVLKNVTENDNVELLLPKSCSHMHLHSERHIEISKGACNWESQEELQRMEHLMSRAESFHMHDHPSCTTGNFEAQFYRPQFPNIRWCCIQRCPKLHTVFLLDKLPMSQVSFERMETICVSHLLVLQCIWGRKIRFLQYGGGPFTAFQKLRYIHLHSCPRLNYILPWSFHTLASLETIHVTYCGELRQIFPKGGDYEGELASTSIEFPSLKHIHLHELPMLQHICEADMLAPALETIILRGCWSLMRLPAISSGAPFDKPLALVDCEKDWWDKLKWDGLEASRPLYSPRHSCYYKKSLPRVSVLR